MRWWNRLRLIIFTSDDHVPYRRPFMRRYHWILYLRGWVPHTWPWRVRKLAMVLWGGLVSYRYRWCCVLWYAWEDFRDRWPGRAFQDATGIVEGVRWIPCPRCVERNRIPFTDPPRFRVEVTLGQSGMSRRNRILLNGVDITRAVQGFTIHSHVSTLTQVTLRLVPQYVRIRVVEAQVTKELEGLSEYGEEPRHE